MTKVEKSSANKAKTHTVYRNKDGQRIPGTTTVIGVMDKPALIKWANNLGLEGIDSSKYVDDLAAIGSLAHMIIEKYLKKEMITYSDYTPNQVETAENSVLKFFHWLEQKKDFRVLGSEMELISEKYQYGGTIDLYCYVDGKHTLIDLKTCKACYGEHYTQVSAYKNLLLENGYKVDDCRILRIGRDDSEGFDDYSIPKIDAHFKRFLICRDLYEVNKELNRK
jgi:hypothetical protein